MEEEVTAAAALQYPRCYSTAGTVHGMAARVWGSPGSLREAERYDCSCLIQTKYVTMFIKE